MTAVPGLLILRGLRCPPVWIDLTVHTDLGPSAESNDMADTVDILDLATTMRELTADAQDRLLESLAVQCARAVLDRFATVDRVEVRISKPDPPGLDAEAEVVEVSLAR